MPHPPSPERRFASAALAFSLLITLVPAFLASRVDPPGNDLALHGVLLEGGVEALREHGWNVFQDPWFPRPNGGYSIFHSYPHLVTQTQAFLCWLTGIDPWRMLGAGAFLAVMLMPLLAFAGARMLGLSPGGAAVAAVVVATMRTGDAYGHSSLAYGFESYGLYGQLWSMSIGSVAFGAWMAASLPGGAGLARLSTAGRVLAAALLLGLVLRISYPAAWVLVLVTGTAVVVAGPVQELPGRLVRYGLVGIVGGILAAGFLVPFFRDLDAVVTVTIEYVWKLRSIGAMAVMGRLLAGQYLDGVAHGPWTPLLLLSFGWTLWAWVRRRSPSPILRGLTCGCAVAVLLLFGRETWGDWMDRVPVIGRFHDHRYLLGLQLLAPLLIAAGVQDLWPRLPRRLARVRVPVAAGVVLVAVVAHGMAGWVDWRTWRSTVPRFEAFAAEIDPLVQRSLADPDARLALGIVDEDQGGTNILWWLRRQGVNASGRPLHQFSAVRDMLVFWTSWMDGTSQLRHGPVAPVDLHPLGISRLAVPAGTDRDPLGHEWLLEPLPDDLGAWQMLDAPHDPAFVGDVGLVRSDLLVRAEGLDMDGFTIAWFLSGLHAVAQYPSMDVGLGPAPPEELYERVVRVTDRDVEVLEGLPGTTHQALGRIAGVESGSRPAERRVSVEVTAEGAWLWIGHSWHPQWRATVDDRPAPVTMLTPGVLGLPLTPGTHDVAVWWYVPAWRGPWAVFNALAYLGIGLGLILVTFRRQTE